MVNRIFPTTRLRRSRSKSFLRDLVAENKLSSDDLIQPLFIADQKESQIDIPSMPGIYRHNLDSLYAETEELLRLGIKAIAIFPAIHPDKKNPEASYAFDQTNIICNALQGIKQRFPEIISIADVALDPYTDHGHDGLLIDGKVNNDETLKLLAQQALILAEAGADIIAPSDMMDGRVKAIRTLFEKEGYHNAGIMSYSAKYASCFYGPFRDALDSKPGFGDKKTYQMDIGNRNEAMNEVKLDIQEGADIVMIKPGISYLDIIRDIKNNFNIPISAYQVSGEYAMIKSAAKNGWINEDQAILETSIAFKRAGANFIASYFAKDVVKLIS